jgi:hypothetical protein
MAGAYATEAQAARRKLLRIDRQAIARMDSASGALIPAHKSLHIRVVVARNFEKGVPFFHLVSDFLTAARGRRTRANAVNNQ